MLADPRRFFMTGQYPAEESGHQYLGGRATGISLFADYISVNERLKSVGYVFYR